MKTVTRKATRKAVKKAAKRAAKKAPAPRPRRSAILIVAALGAVIAAVIAKRALGGNGGDAPSPPDVDRADATWTPQGVQPPIPPEPAASETPQ
jgi:hypothetical protein